MPLIVCVANKLVYFMLPKEANVYRVACNRPLRDVDCRFGLLFFRVYLADKGAKCT